MAIPIKSLDGKPPKWYFEKTKRGKLVGHAIINIPKSFRETSIKKYRENGRRKRMIIYIRKVI